MNPLAATIDCYDHAVPDFVGAELDRLYGSLHSSLVHFRHYGGLEGASTYVARRGSEVLAILLFRIDAGQVQVINEGILLAPRELARFCDYAFTRFSSATRISFHAIRTALQDLPYPCQRITFSEDSVISLPGRESDYFSCLGASTRKNLRHYHSRLRRDFPSLEFRLHAKDEIDERDVHAIIGFNRCRMQSKNRVSAIRDEDIGKILDMARDCGFVGVCRIDGRICAGGIVCRCGDHYYSVLKSHDPRYDRYRLGMLINCLIIQQVNWLGGKEYHLLWGREPYKALLQGVLRDLDDLHVFRSRVAALRNAGLILRAAGFGHARCLKIWAMQESQPTDSGISKWKSPLIELMRRAKRHATGHG